MYNNLFIKLHASLREKLCSIKMPAMCSANAMNKFRFQLWLNGEHGCFISSVISHENRIIIYLRQIHSTTKLQKKNENLYNWIQMSEFRFLRKISQLSTSSWNTQQNLTNRQLHSSCNLLDPKDFFRHMIVSI